MKLAGAVLVLLGGGLGYGLCRRQATLAMRVGEALLGDLAVLSYHVCVCREALPVILAEYLGEGLGAVWFWKRLGEALGGERDLAACWAGAAAALPPPLDRMLLALGPLLAAGDELLRRGIEETREELTGFLRAERAKQTQEGRMTAALCLSGASLLILVLI